MRSSNSILLLLAAATAACRPDPGAPSYPDVDGDTGTVQDGGLPGDDPWDGESPRLSFGAFYESGASDELAVDDETIFFYNYESSFTDLNETDDHVEGFSATRLIVQNGAANGFWGGGIHFEGAGSQDLSAWTTLHLAAKSDDAEMADFTVGMVGDVEGRVALSKYGFAADGEWHVVNIPLADLGVSLDQVSVGFLFIGIPAVDDTDILIDDLYLTAEVAQ